MANTIGTTYINNKKTYTYAGKVYAYNAQSSDLINDLQWAHEVLGRDNVYFEGAQQWAHEIAAKRSIRALSGLVRHEILVA